MEQMIRLTFNKHDTVESQADDLLQWVAEEFTTRGIGHDAKEELIQYLLDIKSSERLETKQKIINQLTEDEK